MVLQICERRLIYITLMVYMYFKLKSFGGKISLRYLKEAKRQGKGTYSSLVKA